VAALSVRGPATIQVFRDPEVGLAITDMNLPGLKTGVSVTPLRA